MEFYVWGKSSVTSWNLITDIMERNNYGNYTVSHKKRATVFFTITLAFREEQFLRFLYRWKRNEYSAVYLIDDILHQIARHEIATTATLSAVWGNHGRPLPGVLLSKRLLQLLQKKWSSVRFSNSCWDILLSISDRNAFTVARNTLCRRINVALSI